MKIVILISMLFLLIISKLLIIIPLLIPSNYPLLSETQQVSNIYSSVSSFSSTINVKEEDNNSTHSYQPIKKLKICHEIIPKEDIRREFINLFMTTLNSYNKSYLQRLLTCFCLPNVIMAYKKLIIKDSLFVPAFYVEIINQYTIKHLWEMIWLGFPDGLFEIQESKINLLSNGFTSIICRYVYIGTQTTDFNHQEEKKETVIYSVKDPITNTSTVLTSRVDISQRKLVEEETKELHSGNIIYPPITKINHGIFTLLINSSNKIIKFEFSQVLYPEFS